MRSGKTAHGLTNNTRQRGSAASSVGAFPAGPQWRPGAGEGRSSVSEPRLTERGFRRRGEQGQPEEDRGSSRVFVLLREVAQAWGQRRTAGSHPPRPTATAVPAACLGKTRGIAGLYLASQQSKHRLLHDMAALLTGHCGCL